MATSNTVRAWLEEKAPRWGKGVNALRLIRTAIGLFADEINDALAQAIRSPWMTLPDQPADALELIGTERAMPRYRADTDDTYRARLLKAWESYAFAGTEDGIVAQYNAFGLSNVAVQAINPGSATQWSQIRVVVYAPHPYQISPRWGSVTWGGFNWGLVPADQDALIGIIRKWKAGHERVMDVIILTEGAALWGEPIWGAFTWGGNPPAIILQVS